MYNGIDFFAVLYSAVAEMLLTYSPEFHRFSVTIFLGLATLKIVVMGYRLWFQHTDAEWLIAKTLAQIAVVNILVTFYSTPAPFFGISFVHLIVDQMHAFAAILDAQAITSVVTTLNSIQSHFVPPGYMEWLGSLLYYGILTVLFVAQVAAMAVIAFGLIAEAILVLVGPLFVPFVLVPTIDFLFWGWFKSLINWSFLPVVGFAYVLIGAVIFSSLLTGMPTGITSDLYVTYGLMVAAIILTWVVGILMIPSLNAGLFSGGGSQSAVDQIRLLMA